MTLIRTALSGLIFATVGAFGAVHSQTLSSFEFESNNHLTYPPNGIYSQNAQKVLHRSDSSIVVFDPYAGNGGARFVLMQRGTEYCKISDMPSNYTINDFDILNDTVYICGRHDVEGDTLSHGFIGYVAINDLFSPNGGNCTYSDIRSTTNLQKVLAYHDNSGEIVAAAFGTQFYADVRYIPEPQSEVVDGPTGPDLPIQPGAKIMNKTNVRKNPVATKSAYDNSGIGWVNDTIRYWDCFAALKIKNIASVTPEYKYDLWRFFYKKGVEIARDMCLTDNYICIVSSYFQEDDDCPPRNQFIIRRIDKNDFNSQWANKMTGAYFAFSTTFDLLKTTQVGNNKIALCYTGITSLGNGNLLYKIDLSTGIYTCSLAHSLDAGCPLKPHVWDLLWVQKNNVLLVLKENGNATPLKDNLWYVSMNQYANTPYNAEVLNFEDNYFGSARRLRFASLDKWDTNYFVLIGSNNNGIAITEKNTFGFYTGKHCNRMDKSEILQESFPTFLEDSLMEHCRFIYTTSSGIDFRVRVLDLPATSPTDSFPFNDVGEMKRKPVCTNEDIDFDYEQPIER